MSHLKERHERARGEIESLRKQIERLSQENEALRRQSISSVKENALDNQVDTGMSRIEGSLYEEWGTYAKELAAAGSLYDKKHWLCYRNLAILPGVLGAKPKWHDLVVQIQEPELNVLVEVQHRTKNSICIDIISKLYNHTELRGTSYDGQKALTKLGEISPWFQANSANEWGKFLNPANDADILLVKLVQMDELRAFSVKGLAARIPEFLRSYGFQFNAKRDKSKIDRPESAFIEVPLSDQNLLDCILMSFDTLLLDLLRDNPRFHLISSIQPADPVLSRIQQVQAIIPSKLWNQTYITQQDIIPPMVRMLQLHEGTMQSDEAVEFLFRVLERWFRLPAYQALEDGVPHWNREIGRARGKAATPEHGSYLKRAKQGKWGEVQTGQIGIWELTKEGKNWKP